MRIARPRSLTAVLCSVALALAACATVPNPLHLLGSQMESSQMIVAPPQPKGPSVKPVQVVTSEDCALQIKLVADDLEVKQELADALKQNAKLKKQLSDEIQKSSFLRDLAVRKMSMN
jgi:hypothetical protein